MTDPIEILEYLVKNGTEKRGEAVCIMWDEEDGFFLSTVDTNVSHFEVKEIDLEMTHNNLVDAIMAAAKWHNMESTKHYRSYLNPIDLTNE